MGRYPPASAWNSSSAKALYKDDLLRAKLPVYSPDGKRIVYVLQRGRQLPVPVAGRAMGRVSVQSR
jgi:Tol biopolymer transport system component